MSNLTGTTRIIWHLRIDSQCACKSCSINKNIVNESIHWVDFCDLINSDIHEVCEECIEIVKKQSFSIKDCKGLLGHELNDSWTVSRLTNGGKNYGGNNYNNVSIHPKSKKVNSYD